MMQKVGPAELKKHFVIMDTICDATQFRQDAVYDLVGHQDQVGRSSYLTYLRTIDFCLRYWVYTDQPSWDQAQSLNAISCVYSFSGITLPRFVRAPGQQIS